MPPVNGKSMHERFSNVSNYFENVLSSYLKKIITALASRQMKHFANIQIFEMLLNFEVLTQPTAVILGLQVQIWWNHSILAPNVLFQGNDIGKSEELTQCDWPKWPCQWHSRIWMTWRRFKRGTWNRDRHLQETHRNTPKHSPRDRHRHTQICIKSCLIEAYHVDFRNVKPSHELVIRRANH